MPVIDEPDLLQLVKAVLERSDPAFDDLAAFLGDRFDAGLAWVHFPPGAGGLGLSPDRQAVVEQAFEDNGAPGPDVRRNPIGLGMVAPTIATHGTHEQRTRFLRPLYSGEEIWCQLFSEPGAGSDLAGLATAAVRDGDEWVVNGQKVWTTLAHTARWGLLQARTDPDAPKHRGMTCFVLDMQAPGVEVRGLRQMTGDAEFNEVYLSDVRIPDRLRLGPPQEGWRVAITTLMNERVSIGTSKASQGGGPAGVALELYRRRSRSPVERSRMARLWIDAEVVRLTNERAADARRSGTPGPEGSVAKLRFAELNQEAYNFCLDLMGPEGSLYPSEYALTRPDYAVVFNGDVPRAFLRSRANSIEGGTSEVMRNVLAERVLGLPGEPRTDRNRPWARHPTVSTAAQSADDPVVVETSGGVAVVTLHRPEVRNAISGPLLGRLRAALEGADADSTVSCVVLTGADPAFCAGLDLTELKTDRRQFTAAPSGGPWTALSIPVIGAINGAAITGGFEIALACDFLIASERAVFGDTHLKVGVPPGWGLTARLPAAIGLRQALEVSLGGDRITALDALRLGLVNHVVPHDELMPFAIGMARRLAAHERSSVRALLSTYRQVAAAPVTDQLRTERSAAHQWPSAASAQDEILG